MNRRFTQIILGFILILLALGALQTAPPLVLLFAVVGFMMLARQFGMTQATLRREQTMISEPAFEPPREERRERDSRGDESSAARERQIHDHALDAARRAGIDVANARVYPVDVGVMAFTADYDPSIYRDAEIPDNVDYIQPYVQLHLPMRVSGNIRFEIRDSSGATLFVHEIQRNLARGDNLITPAARLPIHDALEFTGEWELIVSANGVPVAHHQLLWRETGSRLIRQHIQADGEISNSLKALVENNRLGRLSLDELLEEQNEEEEVIEVERDRKSARR